MKVKTISRGKPADYYQEILKRRYRLTTNLVSLKNKIVLDFGCGNGVQTVEFSNSDCKIIAVDVYLDDLRTLAEYIENNGTDTIIPAQYDASNLPIANNSIDIVVSYEVLEHVQDETQALNEFYRILKPNGEIVMSVPNKGWVFETHGAYLPALPWNRMPFFSWLPHKFHTKFAKARIYRKQDICKLLQTHSFKVLSIQYITAPMDVIKYLKLRNLLRQTIFVNDTTRFSFLATAILVHARKI